jgi:hypothetical protein
MNVKIIITDDDGNVFEGEAHLAPAGAARGRRRRVKTAAKVPTPKAAPTKLDFTKSERAFMKAYAKGLSGTRKFVLLVAYLAKGQVGKEVQLKELQRIWNKMTAILDGKFNTFYSNTAKDDGWVKTSKVGVYLLTTSWKDALS